MLDQQLVTAALQAFLRGSWVTIQLTVASAALGFVIAMAAGLARVSRWRILRVATVIYVELFRGTSLLVQLFTLFYVLPLFGVTLGPVTTGIIGLGLNFGAYGSEIVRAAILGVDPGQREAAVALNMTPWFTMRRIILPQAIIAMLPPFGNNLVEILKATSLVSLITITELSFTGKTLVETYGHANLVYGAVLVIYLVLALPLTRLTRLLERRFGTGMQLGPA